MPVHFERLVNRQFKCLYKIRRALSGFFAIDKVLLLTEILDWTQLFPWIDGECRSTPFAFGYTDHNGPHTWKLLYPESNGDNQSPINITTRRSVVVQPAAPLRWSGYNGGPLSMTMVNDGNTVVLHATWASQALPYIQGGSLTDTYDLYSMVFHWGPSNDEGSEHTVDYLRYPMELQIVHVKRGLNSPTEAIELGAKDGIAIVSLFFQITSADNPYLDHVVTNLWRIARPGAKVHIPPFPLQWIFTPFENNYYTYNGSLTQPPCSEIVTWIVQPEPIAVSSNQVAYYFIIIRPGFLVFRIVGITTFWHRWHSFGKSVRQTALSSSTAGPCND